ncbi:putative glycosyltransferase EpsE [compost metagenome]
MTFIRIPGLVSVVIPCWNAAPFIADCLDSVASQTYPDIELILINDGSSDPSKSMIASWLATPAASRFTKEDRFNMLNLPYNIGYSGANTFGLFMARGEFIAMQDADDLSHPERISKQVAYMRVHPKIGLVGTNFAEFWTDKPQVKFVPKWILYGHEEIKASYDKGKGAACYGSLLFHGHVFDEAGGLIRKLPWKRAVVGHDKLFITRCLKQGFKIDNIPEILYYYRLHGTQMSGRGSKRNNQA